MEENVMLYMSDRNQLEMIKRANEYANRYGLALSDSEIQQLMQKRRECLFEQQRVEFGPGVLDKIIVAFCDSDFIYPDNYSETMEGLQEIFYLYKNESMDVLTGLAGILMRFGKNKAIC